MKPVPWNELNDADVYVIQKRCIPWKWFDEYIVSITIFTLEKRRVFLNFGGFALIQESPKWSIKIGW